MTEMLSALSGGKLLVILGGGYNLCSISSSATAVIKVLLGESPGCNLDDIVPSKSGLRTIFEVLKIQTKYLPALELTFSKLQSRWGIYAFRDTGKQVNRRRKAVVPIWWKWGRKRLFYRVLSKQLHLKSNRC